MSDTPRTDAVCISISHAFDAANYYGHQAPTAEDAYGEMVELARQLERELSAAREAIRDIPFFDDSFGTKEEAWRKKHAAAIDAARKDSQ